MSITKLLQKSCIRAAMIAVIMTIALLGGSPALGQDSGSISVFVDGRQILFDVEPVMDNGRVLVPFRAIGEAVGASVTYEEKTGLVEAALDGIKVGTIIGTSFGWVEGAAGNTTYELDSPAREVNGRVLVPLRFLCEGLGTSVFWDEENLKVEITTKNAIPPVSGEVADYDWNGGTYDGTLLNGHPEGQGTWTNPDGDVYTGNWKDGLFEGKGEYVWANGDRYSGGWKAGKIEGDGVMELDNGDRFTGTWLDGVFNGTYYNQQEGIVRPETDWKWDYMEFA